MGTFTNILIDIEEMWADGLPFDQIAEAINKQYGTIYTEAEIDAAIEQIIEDQDQEAQHKEGKVLACDFFRERDGYGFLYECGGL